MTTTDADAKFTLNLPDKSKGYLLASSERSVFESNVEYYHWIYEVTGQITTPVHLTTSNTLDSQQIGVFLDSFRTSKPYSMEDLINEYNLVKLDWLVDIQNGLAKVAQKRGKISLNKQEIARLKGQIEEILILTEP